MYAVNLEVERIEMARHKISEIDLEDWELCQLFESRLKEAEALYGEWQRQEARKKRKRIFREATLARLLRAKSGFTRAEIFKEFCREIAQKAYYAGMNSCRRYVSSTSR